MTTGNKPIDDGNYLFTEAEKIAFLEKEPRAARYFRPFIGGEELISGVSRWCLWLGDAAPEEIRRIPALRDRVEAVQRFRATSVSLPTRALANTPTRFHTESFPTRPYLALPEVSSENRRYLPMVLLAPEIMPSNKLRTVTHATGYTLGILTSEMHMAWTRRVSGRLKSDIQYSGHIVYNNFPWPTPTEAQRVAIERSAQGILDARAAHPGASLADLYDSLTMPPNLVAAHAANDRAVDAAYGQPRGFSTEAARLAFLFDLYQNLVAPLDATPTRRRPRARRGPG